MLWSLSLISLCRPRYREAEAPPIQMALPWKETDINRYKMMMTFSAYCLSSLEREKTQPSAWILKSHSKEILTFFSISQRMIRSSSESLIKKTVFTNYIKPPWTRAGKLCAYTKMTLCFQFPGKCGHHMTEQAVQTRDCWRASLESRVKDGA